MITGWGTSIRLNKIVVHYYSSDDGLPLCRTKGHNIGAASIPKPNWDKNHPLTCKRCLKLLPIESPPGPAKDATNASCAE